MKNLTILVCFITVMIAFAGCKKNDDVCAACTESVSGYTPPDFCSTRNAVDAYVDELNSQGASSGQHWHCTVK